MQSAWSLTVPSTCGKTVQRSQGSKYTVAHDSTNYAHAVAHIKNRGVLLSTWSVQLTQTCFFTCASCAGKQCRVYLVAQCEINCSKLIFTCAKDCLEILPAASFQRVMQLSVGSNTATLLIPFQYIIYIYTLNFAAFTNCEDKMKTLLSETSTFKSFKQETKTHISTENEHHAPLPRQEGLVKSWNICKMQSDVAFMYSLRKVTRIQAL